MVAPLIVGGALIGAGVLGSSLAGGYFGNKSSKAAKRAAAAAAEEIRQSRARAIGYQQPYYQSGNLALSPLTGLLTGQQYDASTGSTTALSPEQRLALFQTSPGYQFRLDQATKNLQASQAARGGLLSGGAAKELTQYSQGLASDEYNNYINNLFGLAGIGQNAATSMGNYEVGAASQIADYTQAQGLAQAQGSANTGNAFSGGFSQLAGLGGMLFGSGSSGLSGANTSNFSSAGSGQYNNSYFSNPNPSMYSLS